MVYSSYLSADGFVFARLRAGTGRLAKKTGRQLKARGAEFYKEVPKTMAAGARVKITLRCNECKQRNYNTKKNKKNTPDRVEMKKYCRFCRKHTVHTETK